MKKKTDYETIFDKILELARETQYRKNQIFVPYAKVRIDREKISDTCQSIIRMFVNNGDGERALFAGWTREDAGALFLLSNIGLYIVSRQNVITLASLDKCLREKNAHLTLPEEVVVDES